MTKKVTKATEAQKKALGMCEHGHVNYKALEKLNSELYKALRLLRKDSSFKNKMLDDYRGSQIILIKRLQESEKLLEDVTKERNDAIRAYQGLYGLGKFAEEMGIDIKSEKLPENMKDYKFQQQSELLESGKVRHRITVKPNGKMKGWFKG